MNKEDKYREMAIVLYINDLITFKERELIFKRINKELKEAKQ